MKMAQEQFAELLLQMLETEQGGVKVYETALRCVVNDDLKKEWEKYRSETTEHVQIVTKLVEHFEGDADADSPGASWCATSGSRSSRRWRWRSRRAGPGGRPARGRRVRRARRDQGPPELGVARRGRTGLKGEDAKAVKDAFKRSRNRRTSTSITRTGWCRELWIESLGLPAVLPPPEEEKDVKTAIGAARAKKARREML